MCFFVDHDDVVDVVVVVVDDDDDDDDVVDDDDDDDDVKHCYSHRKGHFPNTDRGSLNESHMLEQWGKHLGEIRRKSLPYPYDPCMVYLYIYLMFVGSM